MKRAFNTVNQGFSANSEGGRGELFIYDEIGPAWWGMVDAKSVIDSLDSMGTVSEVSVRLNSPGGDVFEGFAIYNALNRHDAEIQIEVDALAASAASVIAMAGDTIRMAENSMMMIHNAWTVAMGDADDLREVARVLDKIGENIVATYAARTGAGDGDIRDMMDAETWLSADEAVEKGFADSISDPLNVAATISKNRFSNTPKRFVDPAATPEPAAEPAWRVAALADEIRLTRRRLGV